MSFPAFLDSSVLFPAYLCDALLCLADVHAYRPLWSHDVLGELQQSLGAAGVPEDGDWGPLGKVGRAAAGDVLLPHVLRVSRDEIKIMG